MNELHKIELLDSNYETGVMLSEPRLFEDYGFIPSTSSKAKYMASGYDLMEQDLKGDDRLFTETVPAHDFQFTDTVEEHDIRESRFDAVVMYDHPLSKIDLDDVQFIRVKLSDCETIDLKLTKKHLQAGISHKMLCSAVLSALCDLRDQYLRFPEKSIFSSVQPFCEALTSVSVEIDDSKQWLTICELEFEKQDRFKRPPATKHPVILGNREEPISAELQELIDNGAPEKAIQYQINQDKLAASKPRQVNDVLVYPQT